MKVNHSSTGTKNLSRLTDGEFIEVLIPAGGRRPSVSLRWGVCLGVFFVQVDKGLSAI